MINITAYSGQKLSDWIGRDHLIDVKQAAAVCFVFMCHIGVGFSEIDYITKINNLNNDIACHHFDTWYTQNVYEKSNFTRMQPFIIMQEDSVFFLGKSTFLSVFLVWIYICLYHQSITTDKRTESAKRTDCESTRQALNSYNQSTDSSETPVNLNRRITEGRFLIPEPLTSASMTEVFLMFE